MPNWTKKAALSRMQTNARLADILHLEPRLEPIINYAAQCQNEIGYDRFVTFWTLRNQSVALVGWHAELPELRSTEDYEVIIRTLDDLLPPDDVDLYPDGRVVEWAP
jgi:hypothetical protein